MSPAGIGNGGRDHAKVGGNLEPVEPERFAAAVPAAPALRHAG